MDGPALNDKSRRPAAALHWWGLQWRLFIWGPGERLARLGSWDLWPDSTDVSALWVFTTQGWPDLRRAVPETAGCPSGWKRSLVLLVFRDHVLLLSKTHRKGGPRECWAKVVHASQCPTALPWGRGFSPRSTTSPLGGAKALKSLDETQLSVQTSPLTPHCPLMDIQVITTAM